MTKRRDPLRTATRKPAEPLTTETRQIQRIAAGISPRHGMLAALTDLQALREVVDAAELQAVGIARLGGRSWTEIGDALGVSRQAARVRFRDIVTTEQGVSSTE